MKSVVRIHKGSKSIAISTNASNEQEFLTAVAEEIAEQVGGDLLLGDQEKQFLERSLTALLPQVVDICCKLRGYKANVTEHRVIVAGEFLPDDVVEAFSTYGRETVSA